jgi:hypothetical protein
MTILQPMTALEFGHLKRANPGYYSGRWPYIEAAGKLAHKVAPESAIELGPFQRPLLTGSHCMDIKHWGGPLRIDVLWDAAKTPWPLEDASYDIFVALQVWEHLRGAQRDAFRQVMRIAKSAILSFPLEWQMVDTQDCHHGITPDTVSKWTLGIRPVESIVIDKPSPSRKRLVCLYRFP